MKTFFTFVLVIVSMTLTRFTYAQCADTTSLIDGTNGAPKIMKYQFGTELMPNHGNIDALRVYTSVGVIYLSDITVDMVHKTITATVPAGAHITRSDKLNATIYYLKGKRVGIYCCVPTPLPVTLSSFSSQLYGSLAQLSWTTASEINNNYFEVQKSSDINGSWETLAKINSKAEFGNSYTMLSYSYHDSSVSQRTWYRLKQVDYNGHIHYSDVRMLTPKVKPSEITFFPNPVEQGILNLTISENVFTPGNSATLYDVYGKRVKDFSLKNPTNQLSVSDVVPGVYTLAVSNSIGTLSVQRKIIVK